MGIKYMKETKGHCGNLADRSKPLLVKRKKAARDPSWKKTLALPNTYQLIMKILGIKERMGDKLNERELSPSGCHAMW